MGEYARSLAIALAVRQRWEAAEIRFILSRQAPYAAATPFPTTLLDSSPTFHSTAVIDVMRNFHPDVVVFDNAGRTAQLRAAKKLGARLVYISARKRQRNRAFRWRWMLLIDEHWIAYPEFIAGKMRFFEKLKGKILRRPTVRYLDYILSRADSPDGDAIRSRIDGEAGPYVLIVPGGGTGHPGAHHAVAQFFAAARDLAASGVSTVYVGPSAEADEYKDSHLRTFKLLPQRDLGELMQSARLIVTNGGDTLIQAIACAIPSIAVPIAKDQPERIRRCVRLGTTVAATPNSEDIARAVRSLLRDDAARLALARRAADLGLVDSTQVAIAALDALIVRYPTVLSHQ
jgi:predicted glycosyltransferase